MQNGKIKNNKLEQTIGILEIFEKYKTNPDDMIKFLLKQLEGLHFIKCSDFYEASFVLKNTMNN